MKTIKNSVMALILVSQVGAQAQIMEVPDWEAIDKANSKKSNINVIIPTAGEGTTIIPLTPEDFKQKDPHGLFVENLPNNRWGSNIEILSSGTSSVGNGGDGVLLNGKVYVTDLIMGGKELYENPWIGQKTSMAVGRVAQANSGNTVAFPQLLLLRKLSDMDDIYPGLGQMTAEAIKAYTWYYADQDLLVTCDRPAGILDLVSAGAEQIQIANRYSAEIRVHRESWEKMSDDQRVALIIHEAIYAMLKPTPTPLACHEVSAVARKIVRRVFTPNPNKTVTLDPEMIQALNIPEGALACFPMTDIISGAFYAKLAGRIQVFQGLGPKDQLRRSVYDLCLKAAELNRSAPEVVVAALRQPYWTYRHASGVRFVERVAYKEFRVPNDVNTCTRDLTNTLHSYFFELTVEKPKGLTVGRCY